MCEASRNVAHWTDARASETYSISTVGILGFPGTRIGALYAAGTKVTDCIYCIPDGQKLTLSNIPEDLQRQFAIGPTAVVTFEESARDYRDDVLNFGGKKRVKFGRFADRGIEVYIGEKSATDEAVADIIADAQQAALEAKTDQPNLVDA